MQVKDGVKLGLGMAIANLLIGAGVVAVIGLGFVAYVIASH
jgi:hypothetical protein